MKFAINVGSIFITNMKFKKKERIIRVNCDCESKAYKEKQDY